MTAISGTMAQNLWQRAFSKADVNADGALNQEEFLVVAPDGEEAAAVFVTLDTDGDGQLKLDELPQDSSLLPQAYMGIDVYDFIALSSEEKAAEDKAAVAYLFDDADIDGNGELSHQEWDAYTTMNMAAFVDHGASALDQRPMLIKRVDSDNMKPEDFGVARPLTGLEPIKMEDMPPEFQARYEAMQERFAKMETYMTEQHGTDWREIHSPAREEPVLTLPERVQQAPMTSALMSRLFTQLVTSATQESLKSLDLTA